METILTDLRYAMADKAPSKGLGHDFYPYPARMSPAVARYLIQHFSKPGDWVLDPFMGGGTAVVEALAQGRRAVGVDINAIGHLLTLVKTTPLSPGDISALRHWASTHGECVRPPHSLDNWDSVPLGSCLASLTQAADELDFPRRRRFARAVLLRVGQWALDRRDEPPSESVLHAKLTDTVERLALGVSEVADHASSRDIARKRLTGYRRLFHRNAIGLQDDRRLSDLHGAVDLVVTSPPYPGVHVLYHRWQLRSRRETPAPYWIIASQDGHGPSYYTMGGRSVTGLVNYFRSVQGAIASVRPFLTDSARLCMLVAFRDPVVHLALFLQAARQAGFCLQDYPPLWRDVPNRRWYAKQQASHSAAREVLLILTQR